MQKSQSSSTASNPLLHNRDTSSHTADASLQHLITADPGLPRDNPTQSYWQHVQHPLAETQSKSLPEFSDIVVVGSGITGTSVTKFLLEGGSDAHITILEARTLCSGATGRNGGHLVTYGGAGYSNMKSSLGQEKAIKVLKFAQDTCDQTLKAVREYAPEESQIRLVTRIRAFGDKESMDEAKNSVEEFEKDYPEEKGKYDFIDGKTLKEKYDIHGTVGAVTFSAAALWPYRFVTKVIESLMQKYSARLSIETNTPMTKVEYNPDTKYPYQVHTTRGIINTSKIVYCTNGFTGHLLPELRGRLFPYRGTMTVQDIQRPTQKPEVSWNLEHQPLYDPKIKSVITGSYYMQQNQDSGYFFLGGEAQTAQTCLLSDDTSLSSISVRNLQQTLVEYFDEHSESQLISAWSGIMGFTADSCPLVGKLPSSVTKRDGDGEWIAAGYNGMGMSLCWKTGEAIAKKIYGIDVSDWFPQQFEVFKERFETTLTVDKSVQKMQYLLLHDTK